jgi:hypothetical protein
MNVIVYHDKKYIPSRLTERMKKYGTFDFILASSMGDTDEDLYKLAMGYDAVCIIKEGDWLKGKWGNCKTYKGKQLMRVEAREKYWRKWKLTLKGWELQGSKKKADYDQLSYTFEHEFFHALSRHYGKADWLHTYVSTKRYEVAWANADFPLITGKTLLSLAKEYVGVDASPDDKAPDSLGCSDSVSNIIKKILPDFPIIVSTAELFKYLDKDKRFQRTTELTPGNILISPTGYGNGSITGHTGIIGEDCLYSNNSNTGLWDKHFTIKSWVARYRTQGGLPLYVFKLL